MVERNSGNADAGSVPSIAALLTQYRDRTGASYDDMERSIGRSITAGRLHQLATKTPRSFPSNADTIRALADLIQVPVTTVLEAFAVSLGLDVAAPRSLLSITLPPGTDSLTDRDRAAILAVVRQLVEARSVAPVPNLSKVEGLRLAPDDTPNNHDTRTGG